MLSHTRKLLDGKKRPSAAERREVMCKKPGKRHITEIARKMVMQNPSEMKLRARLLALGMTHY